MRQENINKILRVYFEYPGKKFTVRTLASLTKIPRSSVQVLLNDLKKEKLLDKNNESDVDLFIESLVKKELDLGKFEKKLNHKIDLFVESNINNLQENLFNNVVNGIKIYGSFKIK